MKKIICTMLFLGMLLCGNIASSMDYSPLAQSYYNKGVASYKAGDTETAIEFFKKAIQAEPSYSNAYYNIGLIYENAKKIDAAIYNYEKAIEANPYDYDSLYRAGLAYLSKNQQSKALENLVRIPIYSSNYRDAKNLLNNIGTIEINPAQLNTKNIVVPNETKSYTKIGLVDKFAAPSGITRDSKGNIYVANFANNTISKITPKGQNVLYSQDEKINGPVGIACDNKDNLYIANYTGNNVIRITKYGNVSVVIKNIEKPYILYIYNDSMYVSEQGHNTVYKYKLY